MSRNELGTIRLSACSVTEPERAVRLVRRPSVMASMDVGRTMISFFGRPRRSQVSRAFAAAAAACAAAFAARSAALRWASAALRAASAASRSAFFCSRRPPARPPLGRAPGPPRARPRPARRRPRRRPGPRRCRPPAGPAAGAPPPDAGAADRCRRRCLRRSRCRRRCRHRRIRHRRRCRYRRVATAAGPPVPPRRHRRPRQVRRLPPASPLWRRREACAPSACSWRCSCRYSWLRPPVRLGARVGLRMWSGLRVLRRRRRRVCARVRPG